MASWGKMTGMQRFCRVVMIIAMICIAACIAANLAVIIKSDQDTWFTNCDDCAPKGKKKCVKCCPGKACPDVKTIAFFYIMRVYSILFCILAIVAEIKTKMVRDCIKLLDFYAARGMLQIFIGFFTIQGVVAPDDPGIENVVDTCGYILLAVGAIHIVLSCLCFSEYNSAQNAYRGGGEMGSKGGGGGVSVASEPGPSAI